MAIVCEGDRGRVYLDPLVEHEEIAESAQPTWRPDAEFFQHVLGFRVGNYGMTTWGDLFTPRQLVALTTFGDLVGEAIERATADARAAGPSDDDTPLAEGGTGARAYGEAVGVYLGFALDKLIDRHSTLGRWDPTPTASGIINTFSRQALPMSWECFVST